MACPRRRRQPITSTVHELVRRIRTRGVDNQVWPADVLIILQGLPGKQRIIEAE